MIKKSLLLSLAAVWAAVLLPSSAWSQSRTGGLVGSVSDETGARLPGVTVTAESPAHIQPEVDVTDGRGAFRIGSLTPGLYTVTAELAGFAVVRFADIRVDVAREYRLDVTMQVASLAETITVTGESPIVDPKSSTVVANFQFEFLQSIPVLRGSSTPNDFFQLNPGVDASASVAGAPSGGTSWMFDGVEVSSPSSGTAWPFFTFDYIEETTVTTYGASAEYGGATGAVYNVVTKSGGTDHHGAVNFYWSDESLNKGNTDSVNDEFGTDLQAGQILKRYDESANVGGPIIRNKLHYFGSWQRIDETELDAGGSTPQDNPFNRILAKATWQANDQHRLNFSYEYDNFNIDGDQAWLGSPDPSTTSFSPSPTWTPYVHWQWTPDENSVLEAQFSGFYGFARDEPLNDLPPIIDWGTSQAYQSYPGYYDFRRDRSEFRSDYTRFVDEWAGGNHEFKFGVGYMQGNAENLERFNANSLGQSVQYYAYLGEIYGGRQFQNAVGERSGHTRPKTFKLYAQDSWTIQDRLTMNLGIRYDRHAAFWPNASANGFVWNDVSPRAFLTYDVGGDGKTVVRGGWGRYKEGLYGNLYSDFDPSLPAEAFFVFNSGNGGCGATIPNYSNYVRGTECFAGIDAPNVDVLDLSTPGDGLAIDPNLVNEHQNHYVIGFDREIITDWSVSATYILKTNHNLFGGGEDLAQYVPTTIENPLTGGEIQAFERISSAEQSLQILTNRDDVFRREYNGFDVRLKRRFRNNWQFLIAYVIQKAEGSVNNVSVSTAEDDQTRGSFRGVSPNHLINADGELENSRRHVFKIQGSYRVPAPLDFLFGWYVNVQSGEPYPALIRARGLGESVNIFAEPRGLRRLQTFNTLDLRLEKRVPLPGSWGDIAVLVDMFNLNNDDAIDSTNETVGSAFETPLGLIDAREINIGLRWTF